MEGFIQGFVEGFVEGYMEAEGVMDNTLLRPMWTITLFSR